MSYDSVYMEETGMITDMVLDENECMICMESDKPTVMIYKIPHLERVCECEFRVHESCLQNWLSNTPICPICKECLYYSESAKITTNTDTSNTKTLGDSCNSGSFGRCFNRLFCCVSSPDNSPRERS